MHVEELPIDWDEELVLEGKLYRFVDTGITLPLIEIKESDLDRLEGYEFYEPYWVVAQPPTDFAIYDRSNKLIFSSNEFASDYSLESLVQADGYESVEEFREKHRSAAGSVPMTDMEIWVRMGLHAKVYLPSLKRKH